MPVREGIDTPMECRGGAKPEYKKMYTGKQDIFLNTLQTSSSRLLTMYTVCC